MNTVKWIIYTGCILLFSVALQGCDGGGGGGAPSTSAATTTRQTVGPAGGTVRSTDRRLMLTIPAGALGNEQVITITAIDPADLPPAFDGANLDGAWDLGPDGLTFDKPIQVRLTTSQSAQQAPGTLGASLELLATTMGGQIDGLANQKIVVNGSADVVTVTGELSHFSPVTGALFGGLVDITVSGFPADGEIEVGEPFTLTITIEVDDNLILLEPPEYFLQKSDAFISPAEAMPLVVLHEVVGDDDDNTVTYRTMVQYICSAAGKQDFGGKQGFLGNFLFVQLDSNADNPGDLNKFFTETNGAFDVKTTINCVDPDAPPPEDEDPAATILTPGVRRDVASLLGLEATFGAQVLGRGRHFPSNFPLGAAAVFLFAGTNGSAVVDVVNNEVLSKWPLDANQGARFGAFAAAQNGTGEEADWVMGNFGDGDLSYITSDDPRSVRVIKGTTFDVITNACNSVASDHIVFVQPGIGVRFIDYDPALGGYRLLDEILAANQFHGPSATDQRRIVSAIRCNDDMDAAPVLVLAGDVSSALYYHPRGGSATPTRVNGFIGLDARKIRCALPDAPVCAVSVFGDDRLVIYTWDGINMPVKTDRRSVGDGPVGIDLTLLDNGNVGIVSTGFNNGALVETEVTPGGNVVTQVTRLTSTAPNLAGCENPGHAIYVRDAEGVKIIGTCYSSGNYFIVRSRLPRP